MFVTRPCICFKVFVLSLNCCLLPSFTSFFYWYCHTELLSAGNMLVVTTVKPVTSDSQWGTKKVLFLVRILLFFRRLCWVILPNLEWQNLSATKAWIIHKICEEKKQKTKTDYFWSVYFETFLVVWKWTIFMHFFSTCYKWR